MRDQQQANVTHSMISAIPQLFLYDFPVEVTTEISRIYNQSLAKLVARQPDKLSAVGTVPLSHPVKAAEVLQEAMSIGLKGAIIGPGIGQHMLSDSLFQPFFEEANRLNAVIFIHPLLCEDPYLKRRMMPNLIGVPWETTVCATDVLLSGMIN